MIKIFRGSLKGAQTRRNKNLNVKEVIESAVWLSEEKYPLHPLDLNVMV